MSNAGPSRATLERRLQELQGEHDALLSAFAHDFDASLRQTRQFAALLVKRVGADEDEQAIRYRDLLGQALQRSVDMIEGVRAVSRPAANTDEPVEVDGSAIVRETFDSFGPDDGVFSFTGPARIPLRGHPTLLRTLFLKLVDNAVRHAGSDRPPNVSVSAEAIGDGWLFQVRDDGAGFPSDRRDSMFVLFRNIDSSERNRRVGIGLPLCRAIVRRHDGDIRCLSGAPGNTCMAFTLGAELPLSTMEHQ